MTMNESALLGSQGPFWGQPELQVLGPPGWQASALGIRTSKIWFFKEQNIKPVILFSLH